MVDLQRRFPCVADMEKAAKRRMPRFVHDYLIGGLGREDNVRRNVESLRDVQLMPRYLSDASTPDTAVTLFGRHFAAPFAVAPLGLAGLLWPGCEVPIAGAARGHNVSHVLSTFSNRSIETIRPVAGENGWFQFYPPNDPAMEADMLVRAGKAGYETLVLTVDIPAPTRRERDIRNGLSVPPRLDLATMLQIATHPAWALHVLRHGIPEFENLSPYYPKGASLAASAKFVGRVMQGHITAERTAQIRAAWKGKIFVKGVLDPEEAAAYIALGADGLIVSNHGGRQLDAAPSAVDMLPLIRRKLGPDAVILADGGIRSGLDVARMIALGADMVLIGRPFIFASAAIGHDGADHLIGILKAELKSTMAQLGCATVRDLPASLHTPHTVA
ncbi:L-lactate dehydrogenase (cytochrome) [Pararhizobium capsulatum DSM 1112]|uniref:L-lactate dehydrogenase (Cytochrome) n=1 Tax=Pararhizobium capsulatum DSM 1112 TaxID=1121113 RepID=A0ABU0BWB3_9HYPH|nr:alpha-hydroxy acid oxidase [Pararhizobium capsulatum]MDQ0322549.1 L-lactate dehydrogenase (cytochrome) [Pararhizobium capsulatum DSM 1112]